MERKNIIKVLNMILYVIICISIFSININCNASSTGLKSLTINPKGDGLKQDSNYPNIYRVVVENNVTSIEVKAIPNNSKAKVEVSGNKNLKEDGNNKVTVRVIDENNNVEEYKIYVRRKSKSIGEIEELVPNVPENKDDINNNIENEQENIENNELNNIENNANNQQLNNENNNDNDENKVTNNKDKNFEINKENQVNKKSNDLTGIIIFIIVILIIILILSKKKKGKH